MIAIVCIDDNKGMMFNKRRQSRDSALIKDITALASSSKLWMNDYSSNQFNSSLQDICVQDDFLSLASPDDYVFVENIHLGDYLDSIDSIVIYRWNKKYPSDFYFDIDTNSGNWEHISSTDFAGTSHEKITRDIYNKIRRP